MFWDPRIESWIQWSLRFERKFNFFWGGGKVEQLVTVTLTKTFYIDLKLPFKRDPDGLIDNCGVSRTYLKNLTKLLTF